MTEIPAHFAPPMAEDDREPLPLTGTERELLTAFLDWHRETLVLKCAGLSDAELSSHPVPPSGLSLHGLLRHLAGAERWWFRMQFAGEEVPMLHYSDEDPDQDFERLDGSVAEALALWRAECEHSRRIVAAAPTLEATGTHRATGNPISLRRILIHMLAEYARHNGHADLMRESLDGSTGY
ncbi:MULTISPECIES: DinB family protein [unclassified Kitasatospora]|uniref:DinB family protein n=1 Tax=unclassified Kitasatospora TaxID=2633591 RepID=UPI00070A440E|nr:MULTISPECIES: DinB family protein [unclassified Kitasatospora]KQV22243.1 Mini-circle protein [Kitasatospora sp. Root107]KRB64640.1 Mini-circle protein [Kitasatospora sp. Root187]